ncbi:hypothetical protein B0H34DRAFT_657673 [Crassisporium funariophilum]|nr:hypothetical protein B0H34DRAFT_657673 [Crassisporium funariophilum]
MSGTDEYPSMLWVAIPSALLVSAYYVRKWYLARRLRLHGIGKGAPGFQTNVRRVRVTPEIAARIRRGEDVSPAEIAAASKKADAEEDARTSSSELSTSESTSGRLPMRNFEERDDRDLSNGNGYGHSGNGSATKNEEVNEWLPESITGPKKRAKGKKR